MLLINWSAVYKESVERQLSGSLRFHSWNFVGVPRFRPVLTDWRYVCSPLPLCLHRAMTWFGNLILSSILMISTSSTETQIRLPCVFEEKNHLQIDVHSSLKLLWFNSKQIEKNVSRKLENFDFFQFPFCQIPLSFTFQWYRRNLPSDLTAIADSHIVTNPPHRIKILIFYYSTILHVHRFCNVSSLWPEKCENKSKNHRSMFQKLIPFFRWNLFTNILIISIPK